MNSIIFAVLGTAVTIGIGYLLSNNKKQINWRTILVALLIQFVFGFFTLYSKIGSEILFAISEKIQVVIGYSNQGINFLFGGLRDFSKIGFVFALYVLPSIIFFASLISVLYYIGVMKFIINIIGGGLRFALGTSKTESLSAAANIFVGQTEAPLLVKPYIASMTESELFAIMTGGLASVAGSVLVGYSQMGVPLPYLIAASFMAAPGGLLFAKLIIPETDKTAVDREIKDLKEIDEDAPTNVLEAAAVGASSGLQLAMNVGAMLLAFIALIALLNGILGGLGGLVGYGDLSLEKILGWIFSPLAWISGVPWSEAQIAGSLIGQKLVVNEFVAFSTFSQYLSLNGNDPATLVNGVALSPVTVAIVSFTLTGFANLSSIAILIGGLGVMAPKRRKDVSRLGIKAVIAGALSNMLSGIIAGLFISFGV